MNHPTCSTMGATCERCGLPFAEAASDLSRYDVKCFRRFPTLANEDGCKWAQEKRQKLLAEPMVIAAIEAARTISDIPPRDLEQHWQLFLPTIDREALGPERVEQLTNAIRNIERERDEFRRMYAEQVNRELAAFAAAQADIHAACGMCGKPIENNVYVRLNDKYVHQSCHVEGIVAECDDARKERDYVIEVQTRQVEDNRRLERERDEALAYAASLESAQKAQADVFIEAGEVSRRRIAELEAALAVAKRAASLYWHNSQCDNGCTGEPYCRRCKAVIDAFSDAPAQPATATKEAYEHVGDFAGCETLKTAPLTLEDEIKAAGIAQPATAAPVCLCRPFAYHPECELHSAAPSPTAREVNPRRFISVKGVSTLCDHCGRNTDEWEVTALAWGRIDKLHGSVRHLLCRGCFASDTEDGDLVNDWSTIVQCHPQRRRSAYPMCRAWNVETFRSSATAVSYAKPTTRPRRA